VTIAQRYTRDLVNRQSAGCLLELLETFLVFLLVFVIVQLFVAEPFQVRDSAMNNTLAADQYVLIDKISLHFDSLHRGDLVVFKPPSNSTATASPAVAGSSETAPAASTCIERVIGVAGDTIDIHGGHVYLNGQQLTEAYVAANQSTSPAGGTSQTWKLTTGQVFVLGDHRQDKSLRDSRNFGPIPTSIVEGRAFLRYWPFSKFGLIPQTGDQPAPSASPLPTTAP
jgi:signal peptidase I